MVAAGELALCGFTEKVTLGPRVMCIPRLCEGEAGRAWHVSGITGGHVPRAEQGIEWEEMRSLSASVFSRTGLILLIFSLSEMGSPWAGGWGGGRGGSRGEASLVMFEQDCQLLSTG